MLRQMLYGTALGLLLSAAMATAQQNTAVDWSVLDQGFVDATSGNTSVRSAAGQAFVGLTVTGNSQIASGFLADKRLRGPVVSVNAGETIPQSYALMQNYPNPFNPATTIEYQVPVQSTVRLIVFDVLGREVSTLVNGAVPPGLHSIHFDAREIASGPYFFRMVAEPLKGGAGFVAVRKLLLLK